MKDFLYLNDKLNTPNITIGRCNETLFNGKKVEKRKKSYKNLKS